LFRILPFLAQEDVKFADGLSQASEPNYEIGEVSLRSLPKFETSLAKDLVVL